MKVGDTIKFKSDMETNVKQGDLTLYPKMAHVRGEEAVLIEVQDRSDQGRSTSFKCDIGDDYWYNEEMLEKSHEPGNKWIVEIDVSNDEGIYEHHRYHRYGFVDTEKMFWDFCNRYGSDSFFKGYTIKLKLYNIFKGVAEHITLKRGG